MDSASGNQEADLRKIPNNIFLSDKVASILGNWVKTVKSPDVLDIANIEECIFALCEKRRFGKIKNGMLIWCNLLNKFCNSTEYCDWHRAYKDMEIIVMEAQLDMFGECILTLDEEIECNAC